MSQDAKEIFTKIASVEERQKLVDDLIRLKVEVVCKLQNSDELIRLDVLKTENRGVTCALRKGSLAPTGLPAEVVVSFELTNEKFFLTTMLSPLQAGYFDLRMIDSPIFRLQRRQSYRVRLPDRYASKVQLVRVNGTPSTINGKVADLSTGGCRMKIVGERKSLNANDVLEGKITLGGREPFEFRGQVRHERSETAPPAHYFGIEFLELPAPVAARLFAITLELHREVFSKWE